MKKIILSVLILICIWNIQAQDIHFSQWDAAPLFLNPALTGGYNGNHRAILNYREQWKSVAYPYKTVAFQYDGTYFKKLFNFKDKLNLGFSFFSDKAGEGNMGITQATIYSSFYKGFKNTYGLTAGFQLGYSQNSLNIANLTWDNQNDGGIYNPDLPSGEPQYNNKFSFIDIGTGLCWDYRPHKLFAYNLGLSIQHVQPTEIKYYNEKEILFRKFTIHGTMETKFKKSDAIFYPAFIYRKQGPSQEFIYGTMIKYQLSEEKHDGKILDAAVQFGVFHRWNDAFVFVAKLSYMHFTFGISYDTNYSKLSNVSNYKGGIELSLLYISPYSRRGRGNSLL
ncbi:MAG: PorP/SprF family type IX secretion system membrane protein [Bacteroidia bacterium]|nr:PorP/SprF family type IX secretion system membrane protein [Bacteroidia bacterium]